MIATHAQEIREVVCELQARLNAVCAESIRIRLETIYREAGKIIDETKEEERVNEALENESAS